MRIQLVLSAVAILLAWMVVDLLLHRLFLRPLYEQNPALWRSFDHLNIPLIYVTTFMLIGVFIGVYALLIQPKSLGAGLAFGAFLGLALGVGSAGGTYIHMPIPRTLAWGWLIGGWLKGIVAGAILGMLSTGA
jgi:hypothetical protein